MDRWLTVRKGGEPIYVEYAHVFSGNLLAHNTQLREEPELEIRVDLSPNLRGRSKETGTYLDATDLAGGDISELRLFQTEDERLLKALSAALGRIGGSPDTWKLTVLLAGEWSFRVRPDVNRIGSLTSLLLHVVGQA